MHGQWWSSSWVIIMRRNWQKRLFRAANNIKIYLKPEQNLENSLCTNLAESLHNEWDLLVLQIRWTIQTTPH